MATKMKLPIIVLCILSVVLTIGLVTFKRGRFGDEELSTFEFYSEECLTLDDLYLSETSTEEEIVITLEYDENSELKTTLLDADRNLYAPVVSVTKKAEVIVLDKDPTAVETFTDTEGYETYFTESDVRMVAKTIYGEARSSQISRENKAKVAWVILNRVDDPKFPNTIAGVITAPNQFHGYISSYPVTDLCYEIAKDVLTRWSMEKQGANVYRELPRNINAFYGDGRQNHFYEAKW